MVAALATPCTSEQQNPDLLANPRATPSLDRGLALIRAELGAGRGFPTAEVLQALMGYRNVASARDLLVNLEVRGLIRREPEDRRRGGRGRRSIYTLTVLGQRPSVKWCRACCRDRPAAYYQRSRFSHDGLSGICEPCIRRRRKR